MISYGYTLSLERIFCHSLNCAPNCPNTARRASDDVSDVSLTYILSHVYLLDFANPKASLAEDIFLYLGHHHARAHDKCL